MPLLYHLKARHVLILSQVSRLLRRACDSQELWAHLCQRDFGEDAEKILTVYERAELPGSPERVISGLVVGGRALRCGVIYKQMYRKMLDYEIELHFQSGHMGNHIIKIVGKECCVQPSVLGASASGNSHADDGSRVVCIGRSRTNDISILHDEMVSRKHGELYRAGIFYYFKDVGSINGTFVNNDQIPKLMPIRLRLDDHVELGATRHAPEQCFDSQASTHGATATLQARKKALTEHDLRMLHTTHMLASARILPVFLLGTWQLTCFVSICVCVGTQIRGAAVPARARFTARFVEGRSRARAAGGG